MRKTFFTRNAVRLGIAATLLLGTSVVANTETARADSMGCYGWFDYVYKSTGDVNFAYYHFLVCRGEAVAPKLHKAEPGGGIIKPIDGSVVLPPSGSSGPRQFVPVTR